MPRKRAIDTPFARATNYGNSAIAFLGSGQLRQFTEEAGRDVQRFEIAVNSVDEAQRALETLAAKVF